MDFIKNVFFVVEKKYDNSAWIWADYKIVPKMRTYYLLFPVSLKTAMLLIMPYISWLHMVISFPFSSNL